MKYLIFLVLFVPPSAIAGIGLGVAFGDWIIGAGAAALLLGLSADVCFFGSDGDA